MRVLVTGAAGFLGSWLAERLVARGDEVVGLDNFDLFYPRAEKEANLAALRAHPGFSLVEGDLLDEAALASAFARRPDAVCHLAALAGVQPSLREPARYLRVNVEGTVRLLESCRRAGVRRVVAASSSAVYGRDTPLPFSEDARCERPASPYAASKRAMELVAAASHEIHGLGVTCLRYFSVYGPRQRPDLFFRRLLRAAEEERPAPLFGGAESGRDFTFIDDIIDGTVAALERQDGGFHVYNLGGGAPLPLSAALRLLAEALGRKIPTEPLPARAGDLPWTAADLRRAREELGYAPKVDLAEGLRALVRWHEANAGKPT